MNLIPLIVILCFLGVLLYFRFASSRPNLWHASPSSARTTGKPNEYRLVGEDAIVFNLSAMELSKLVDDFITSQDRVKILVQNADKTHSTYIQRSKLFGYPDYISLEITDIGNGQSKLELLSRSRFGYSDLGVNKGRIDNWITAINGLIVG